MRTTEKQKAACKRYYEEHRDKLLTKAKSYYSANRDAVLAQKKARYIKHPRILRERSVSWYWKNRDKVRAYRRTEEYKQKARAWDRAHPEQTRKNWLKQRYGITPETYDELLKKQRGVCAICGNGNDHPTRWGKNSVRLTVDHCHATGKLRGLLCHKCNAGLGLFGDSLERVKAAATYLSR